MCRRDTPAELAKETDAPKNDNNETAFTFKKVQPRYTGGLLYSTIEVESKPLLDLLNKGIKQLQYGIKETITSPFEWLVWNWDTISDEASNSSDQDSDDLKQARVDLKELLKTISTQSGVEKLDTYFSKHETYKKEKTITHEALWTIFAPGTVVFSQPVLDQPQLLFVLDHSRDFPDPESAEEPFELRCYTYDWNGSTFNRIPLPLKIDYFKDKQNISALSVYPVEYHDDEEGLRTQLIARGKKYVAFCIAGPGEQMFKYNGPVICQKEGRLFQDPSTFSNDQSDSESTTSSMRRS